MIKQITSFLRSGSRGRLFMALVLSFLAGEVAAQCLSSGYGQYPAATFSPPCSGFPESITTAGWAGEYSVVDLTEGEEYIFSSSIATDYLTIASTDDTTVAVAHGPSPVTFTPTTSGTYRFYQHVDEDCTEENSSRSRFIQCGTPPPAPANDECANAIALSVNADMNCGQVTSGTVLGATESADAVSCTGTEDDDVWYSFTATATTHQISLLNVDGSVTDMAMELLDGCGGASLFCSDPESFFASGLTVGSTYLLRVYTYTSNSGQNTTFDICIGTLPPPPANDEPQNAVALTVNSDYACGATTAGTTFSASESSEVDPSCSSSGTDDDVWYTFVATGDEHRITVEGTTTTTVALAVYAGTPGSLTQITGACASTTVAASNLTTGTTYYVRVYTTSSTVGVGSNFEICVGTPPPLPPNDECADAIDISSGLQVSGTSYSATESQPGCTGIANDDVWYQFTTGVAGDVTITVVGVSSGFDAVLEVFSGTCESLTSIECRDQTASGAEEYVLTADAGTTYYMRVYDYSGTNDPGGNFTIVATGTPLPVEMDALKGRLTQEHNAVLTWTTFKEAGNKGFDIQRSENGKDFQDISFVSSKAAGGNSTEAIAYAFTDQQQVTGEVYYRLMQHDIDGKTTLSNVVRLAALGHNDFAISAYPNPATDKVTLMIKGQRSADAQVMLTDVAGKVVHTRAADADQFTLDMSGLPPGLYFIKYADGKHHQVIKISKQ